jgi:hypothetical protein
VNREGTLTGPVVVIPRLRLLECALSRSFGHPALPGRPVVSRPLGVWHLI